MIFLSSAKKDGGKVGVVACVHGHVHVHEWVTV